jgi:quercetin dioxygenase-like cupin family protein
MLERLAGKGTFGQLPGTGSHRREAMISLALRSLQLEPAEGAHMSTEAMRRISIAAPEFKRFPDFPDGFRPGIFRLGALVGAVATGMSMYELPPGQAIGPYHYENPEEEWLLVLEGQPTLRNPEGEDVLEPWDVVFFPPGHTGAHMVRNDSYTTRAAC